MGGVLGAQGGMLQPVGMPPAPPPPASMGVVPLDCHGPPPQHQQLPTPTPSNVQNMQNIETRNIQEELNQEPNSNQMPEDCQNELCCPIDQSEEAMQPQQHCSCEAVEVNFIDGFFSFFFFFFFSFEKDQITLPLVWGILADF